MLRFLRVLLSLFLLFSFYSCSHGQTNVKAEGLPSPKGTVSYEVLGSLQGGVILVEDTIDLQNKACSIPEGYLLKMKGGYIKNGTLIGNKTQLKSSKACFSRVRILGTWNVPVIKSSLFGDLTYDNALKDVVALASSSVNNRVYIEKGTYQVSAYYNDDVCIPIGDYTELILDGDVWLTPNDYRNSNIIRVTGNKIKIRGKGTIAGDKHTHKGNSGEWGMGIDVEDGHDVLISGITIKDCWGDCIYVGSTSTDVKIQKCKLDHGRRQGISITKANRVLIRDCTISNVCGTAPGYAIDVEPNKNDSIDSIVIERVKSVNCKGGIGAYGKAQGAWIGHCVIRNCSVEGAEKVPMPFEGCDAVKVEKCRFKNCTGTTAILCKSVKDVKIVKNEIAMEYGLKDVAKKIIRRGEADKTIATIDCESVEIK